jgi:pseudouridine kinase
MAEKYAVIIGGLNLDLAGLCGDVYRQKDSNLGNITISAGGVGQNIAQNLTRLETPTYLVTVYGDDYFGNILTNECGKNGIHLDYAECIPGANSSTYLYVTDDRGDMVTAINDMAITTKLTPEFLEKRLDFINQAEICILDGNIPQASIEWLAEHVTAPIFADPVSIAKVGRFENVLDKIDTFKPNELEAEFLTGIKIVDKATAQQAAEQLNTRGIKNVFISLGEHGILCARDGQTTFIPILKGNVVSVNGAGDCSMATIAWARFYYGDALAVQEVGELTQAAASITVESPASVSPELNVTNVVKRAKKYYESERVNS